MTKALFIECIKALKKQEKRDIKFMNYMSKAFPDAFPANLLPDKSIIENMFLKLLRTEMNDMETDKYGQSWIDYFCYELNYGKDFKPGMVTYKDKDIDLSDAGKLYDFLKNR